MVNTSKPSKFTYKSQRRSDQSALSTSTRPAKRIKTAVFDDEARREYLSGFSKRKKAKKEAARLRSEEKLRSERNEMRAQLREQRKEQAANNLKRDAEFYRDPDQEIIEEAYSEGETHNVQELETLTGEKATVTIQELDLEDPDEAQEPRKRYPSSSRSEKRQRARQKDARKRR